MCNNSCPLENLCEKRISVANYILMKQVNDSRLRDETTTWQATGEDSENLDALVNDINTSKSLILHSAAIVRLGFQVPKELTAQALEKINCTGPIKIRKYGWLGKVISIDCGSLERKERLKNHLNENFHTGQSELGQTL